MKSPNILCQYFLSINNIYDYNNAVVYHTACTAGQGPLMVNTGVLNYKVKNHRSGQTVIFLRVTVQFYDPKVSP